jgi:dihydropyrimidinase
MGILIKNGEVVTSTERYIADVYCENGKIVAIGTDLEKASSKDRVIDAKGQFIFPGGIDAHVHMELGFMGTVSADDFETGTAAGVAGGTTSIIDFVIPNRDQPIMDALEAWHAKAEKSVSDYAFHMALTWFGDDTAKDMRTCVEKHGISSFKTFMAYKGAIGVDDEELIRIMEAAKGIGALVSAHCEHGDAVVAMQQQFLKAGKTDPKYHAQSRPSWVEGEATNRAIQLARINGNPIYIVHLTCEEALDAVREARNRGQVVLAETCAQYLLLDDSVYDKPDFEGAAYVMSPPIRPKHHQDKLWAGISSGLIQVVATDHCPFNQEGQKDMGKDDFTHIPNGAAGIENRLGLLWTYGVKTGKLDIHRFVDIFATQPAKIFGMYPQKGSVVIGGDADLVIFDPNQETVISSKTNHHNCDRSIFEGFAISGKNTHVIVNGRVQFEDGKLDVEKGKGRYISRNVVSHY